VSEVLKCVSLTKKYGKKLALNGVNISLGSGKIVGLLGPNGSGKTTMIKLINGLLQPNSGEIFVNGEPLSEKSKALISYLPDNTFLNSWMTIDQLLNMFSDFFSDFRRELAVKLLTDLGLSTKDKLRTLSKGNKEKVCLILVLSRNAMLYVLDEPIAGVDPATRDYIISTIINNHSENSTVLISTHLITDIEPCLDEVIFIQNGEVSLHKSVESIHQEENKSVDELFREMYKW